jgi:hypothetical protein
VNNNDSIIYLWDSAVLVHRGKIIALIILEKKKVLKLHDLNFYSKKIEKGKQIKFKATRRKKMVKLRGEIDGKDYKYRKSAKSKFDFLKKLID